MVALMPAPAQGQAALSAKRAFGALKLPGVFRPSSGKSDLSHGQVVEDMGFCC